jgi:TatD DNase family protein
MQLTDTHCHLDFEKFDSDREAVIDRAREAGVARILIPSITLKSSREAVKLAESRPMLYAAIGIHPTDSLTWDPQTVPVLRELAASFKVVAVGEIGLDYYWDTAPHDHQRKVLRKQLDLAGELSLPVVIHMREKGDADHGPCAEDLLEIIQAWVSDLRRRSSPLVERPGVLHSFAGNLATAQAAIRFGFCIGVTGPVTYKNARQRQQVISALPLESLLIETDAPFLAPQSHRGTRNEPAFVGEIADKIAQLHSRNLEDVAAVSSANATRLFSWGETA